MCKTTLHIVQFAISLRPTSLIDDDLPLPLIFQMQPLNQQQSENVHVNTVLITNIHRPFLSEPKRKLKKIYPTKMLKSLIFLLLLLMLSSIFWSHSSLASRNFNLEFEADRPHQQANGVNDPFNCAALPPALWCACESVQEKCGTKEKCQQYEQAVRNQPVHITLLYESLCPDCMMFISNKLLDVYNRFRNQVRIELVPFGNAQVLENGTIQCQHGPEECRINKYESCAINYMHEPLPFIYCLETLIANGASLEKASRQCYAKIHPLPHIFDQITHCFNGPKGDKLQKLDAQRTASIWPDQHEFVPWILLNNASFASQQFLMKDLGSFICQSYMGDSEIDQ